MFFRTLSCSYLSLFKSLSLYIYIYIIQHGLVQDNIKKFLNETQTSVTVQNHIYR